MVDAPEPAPHAAFGAASPSNAHEAQVRFVFGSGLASYLAEVRPDVRARERTILVNAERFEVLALLEAHDLGGAIECEEQDSWTADDARMFVRKEALELADGTVIGGPGRESERFVLWTRLDPNTRTCKLAALVRAVANALRSFATRFAELVITADAAERHELPAIGMRMVIGRVGLVPTVFPSPATYVRFDAPPGGLQVFDVSVCAELAPEAVVRESFRASPDPTLRYVGIEDVRLAGATRVAVLCETGGDDAFTRMGWYLVAIQHAAGRLVVRLANRLPVDSPPSWASAMRFAGHKILTDSFTLIES